MLEYIKSSEIHTLIQANLKSSVKSLLYYFDNIELRERHYQLISSFYFRSSLKFLAKYLKIFLSCRVINLSTDNNVCYCLIKFRFLKGCVKSKIINQDVLKHLSFKGFPNYQSKLLHQWRQSSTDLSSKNQELFPFTLDLASQF